MSSTFPLVMIAEMKRHLLHLALRVSFVDPSLDVATYWYVICLLWALRILTIISRKRGLLAGSVPSYWTKLHQWIMRSNEKQRSSARSVKAILPNALRPPTLRLASNPLPV